MPEYIAFLWNFDDLESTSRARLLIGRCKSRPQPMHVVFERAGVVVLSSVTGTDPELQVLERSRGAILGTLFRRPGAYPEDDVIDRVYLTSYETERVVASKAGELVERYWGDYVAFLCDDNPRCMRILRGPSATLPCFHTSTSGVQVYFSSVELCAQIEARCFSIHWMNLARSLFGPALPGTTDINQVREVLPGICECCRDGVCTQEVLWDPAALARAAPIDNPDEAARRLRAMTRACVQARASQHACILVGLSGGLDSSVVLSCLADTRTKPRIICVNQYGDDAASDERVFARAAAARAGCELIEYRRHSDIDLQTALHAHRSATSPGLRMQVIDRIEPDLARRRGATALFRGEGGDEIFCRNQLPLYVADFLRTRGFQRDVLGLAMHAATVQGVTAWQILGRAVWDAFVPQRWNFAARLLGDLERATLLRADVIAQLVKVSSAALPYARSTREAPPGRLWQISLICARRGMPNPFMREGDPVSISPLLSQPLIELCLRIPTYLQMMDRRDRSLTRRAFAADLAPEVAHRRDKGGAEPLASAMLLNNLPFLREMLLDGLVVQQGIVDLRLLEGALSSAPSPDSVTSVPLFDLLGAEIWARAWCGRSPGVRQNVARTESA